jgi:hypothetical protein
MFWPDDVDAPVVRIKLSVIEGGIQIKGLAVTGMSNEFEIDASLLRELPLKQLKESAVQGVWAEALVDQLVYGYRDEKEVERLVAASWQVRESALAASRQRRPVTEELLLRVADVYLSDQSHKPTDAVAKAELTSHRNAGRLVALARERGFIPPYNRRTQSG